jgi:hypothetical protein
MKMINTLASAAPVWTPDRERSHAPISAAQGTGVSFAGYGAVTVTDTTTPMTLGAVRNDDGSRAPARGRPL